uniref:Uncharacterized protein n=1 Tax=Strongyloides stercoralis TaxID=6248 RepID=A0A0K0DS27_STRER
MSKLTYTYFDNNFPTIDSCDSGYNSDTEDNAIDNYSYSIYTIVARLELMLLPREIIKKEEMKKQFNNKKYEKQ